MELLSKRRKETKQQDVRNKSEISKLQECHLIGNATPTKILHPSLHNNFLFLMRVVWFHKVPH